MVDEDRLSEMASKALAAWPGLRYRTPHQPEGFTHRGEAAADLVRRGLVEFRGDLPFTGNDEWQVSDHSCSHRGQQCSCADHTAPTDPKLGRLCKHRLAVMMVMRLRADTAAMLSQIISTAASHDAERVTLGAVRVFGDNGHDSDRYTLSSYRERGRGQVNIGGDGQAPVHFSAADLHKVLAAAGWRVHSQTKQAGYNWDIYLEPAPPARSGGDAEVAEAIGTGIGRLDAPDAGWTERVQRERRLAARLAADLGYREEIAA